jgi:hypothetical protein
MATALQRSAAALDAPFGVGAAAVLVFAIWAGKDAGFAPVTWYPGALFLVALAAVALLAFGRITNSRPALAALAFLTAFTIWSALSIAWSSDRGIAWDGANRTVLYLVVYAVFVLLPWRLGSVAVLMCAFSFVVLVTGVVGLARAAGDPGEYFIGGRLAAPAGYPNAACALFMLAFWAPAYLAAQREVPPLFRALLLGFATGLVELAVLTQSRGSLFAVPVAVILYLAVVPRRLRAASALAAVAVAAVVARPRLLAVFDAVRAGAGERDAITRALVAMALTAGAVTVLWAVWAIVDSRIDLSPKVVRVGGAAAAALVVGALVVGVVAVARADPGPRERLGDAWRNFKAGYPEKQSGSHFSLGLGSNRYDFWRVALAEFKEHPLRGVGVDNFAHDYTRERRSSEEPLHPHSLPLRVLAQTGIVGAALFAGFLVSALVGVFAAARGGSAFARGLRVAAAAGAAYFLLHGSGDWLWEFAGLGAPAFAWLGAAASSSSRSATFAAGRLTVGAGVVLAAALAASLVFPWWAEVEARRAVQTWGREPQAAFARLDRARDLNPLSARSDLLAGAIASRTGDLRRMRLAFRRAVQRDPDNWYAHFELAVAHAGLGARRRALESLATARRLNPRERVIERVRRAVAAGRPIDRVALDRLFAERVRSRVGPR